MKLVILALTLFSVQSFAATKTVTCTAQDGILYNQFEGTALITLSEDDDSATGLLSFTTSRPGFPNLQITGKMDGTFKNYAPGTIGKDAAQAIQLLDKGADVSVAVINLGMPGPMTSTLIADGVTYKSACH